MKNLLKSSVLVIVLIFIITSFILNIYLEKNYNISIINTFLSGNLLKKYNQRVNILILGIAGGNHDGATLSDSIIVCSYNLNSNILTTISIPRDIWSATLKDKVNSAYAYGEAKIKGGGKKLAKAEIAAIIGQPIHYAIVIDFNRFKEIIDFLGGISIQVNNSFTDNRFPIAGKENDTCGDHDLDYKCRYETISFVKGEQIMNGETALKYVRSRHADGIEGNDFSRENRQQAVIEGIKKSIINLISGYNFKKINQLYLLINKILDRDINNQQLAIILKNIIFKKNFVLKKYILSNDMFIVPEYSSLYNYKWVLIPVDNTYQHIHSYVNCVFDEENQCDLKNKGKENQ